jgi:tetratricopeptide (TPR) repeat protein
MGSESENSSVGFKAGYTYIFYIVAFIERQFMSAPLSTIAGWSQQKFMLIVSVCIIVVAFVFYGNSIENEFALDDELVTTTDRKGNENVEKGFAGIPDIFTSHYAINQKQSYGYRPVTSATYAIEYEFFGGDPHSSHFINILLYALICVLMFYVLWKHLMPDRNYLLPLLITLIFLIHPLHSEVVNNLKSRDELLCFGFFWVALYFYLKFYDKRNFLHLVGGVFFLTLIALSKSWKYSLMYAAVVPLTIYFFRTWKLQRFSIMVSTMVVPIAVLLIMKKSLLEGTSVRGHEFFENPLFDFAQYGFFDRIPMYFYSLFYYIKLLVFPYELSFYYGYSHVPLVGWGNVFVLLTVLALGVLLYFMVKNFLKKKIWVYGALFFLLAIGGACNLLFPNVGMIAERFAFAASFGFCVVIAYLILYAFKIPDKGPVKIKKTKTYLFALIGVLFMASLVRVYHRNQNWKDHITLYLNDVKHAENSAKIHALISGTIMEDIQRDAQQMNTLRSEYNSAVTNKNQAKLNELGPLINKLATYRNKWLPVAKSHYLTCLRIYPKYLTTYNNLGTAYFMESTIDDGYIVINKGLGNLGPGARKQRIDEYRKTSMDSAHYYFREAVKLDSTYVQAHYNAGASYEKKGNLDSAIYHFERAIHFDPTYMLGYTKLHGIYLGQDKKDDVLRLAEKGMHVPKFKDNDQFWIYAANIYVERNEKAKGLEYYEHALEIQERRYRLTFQKARGLSYVSLNRESNLNYKGAGQIAATITRLCTHLGTNYSELGEQAKAEQFFERAKGWNNAAVQLGNQFR